ncbi:MAG TPA: TonB-dependent receptor, partial [Acidobacteriaceae bacterium]
GSGFVQDDWKFTPKLTLNLGLRYEARTGWSEVHGNMRLFDPTLLNPATNTLGAMWYASTHTNGRTTAESPRWNNWYPRVGFAYQLYPTTTIRGGFGIYAYQWNANWDNPGIGQAGGSSGNESDATNNVQPVVTLNDDGNTNFQGALGTSINARYQSAPNKPESYNGQGVGFQQYHSAIPVVKEWNLDLQQQIANNMVFELSYVGSHGSSLPFVIDMNQVPERLLSPTDSPGSRPFPQYQGITGFTPQSISNYNAMEVTLARRMSYGLEFNANYTWSHFLDTQDSSGWNSLQGTQAYQRSYDPLANYGASNFDVRNAFKAQAIYQLPFGKNKMWLNKSEAVNEVVGGWTASATYIGQGGHPFTPTMSVNNSYAQSGSWYPNQVASPILGNRGINGWFNTAAFAAPTPGTFGNMRRNSVYGPGLQEMNASVHKRFPIIGERVGFDFSANATNVLNHPSFGQPDSTIGPGHTATIRSLTVGGRTMEFVGKIIF